MKLSFKDDVNFTPDLYSPIASWRQFPEVLWLQAQEIAWVSQFYAGLTWLTRLRSDSLISLSAKTFPKSIICSARGDLTKQCLMAMIPKTSPELRTQPWPRAGKWVACSPSCVGPARSPRPRWSQVGFLGPGHRWRGAAGAGRQWRALRAHQSCGNVRRERRQPSHPVTMSRVSQGSHPLWEIYSEMQTKEGGCKKIS